ncbi:MAG: asparagine synthase-related protein [Sumerlaeia bacterium]
MNALFGIVVKEPEGGLEVEPSLRAMADRMAWRCPAAGEARVVVRGGFGAGALGAGAVIEDTAAGGLVVAEGLLAGGNDPGAAWERWGAAAPERLAGEFALAVVAERELFLARDRFGMRALVWAETEAWVAFATDARALLALPRPSGWELEPAAIARHLLGLSRLPEETAFAGIRRVPAAHRVVWRGDAARIERYWNLAEAAPEAADGAADVPERLRAVFRGAVGRQLAGLRRPAAAVSGGLDSSSVAAMAQSLSSEPLAAYRAVFPKDQAADESRFSDAVIAQSGMLGHAFDGGAENPLLDMEDLLGRLDHPFYPPNHFLQRRMYRDAAARGCDGFFEGNDGDNALSHGLGRLRELARAGAWRALAAEYEALRRRRTNGMDWPHPARAVARDFWRWRARRWRMGGTMRALGDRLALGTGDAPGELESLISPEFRESLNLEPEPPLRWKTEREAHIAAITAPCQTPIVEFMRASAAQAGLDLRLPFFDAELIAFCVGLRSDWKLRDGWTRYSMRQAMAGLLPDAVRWRAEKGRLDGNFQRVFQRDGREATARALWDEAALIEPYVDLAAARTAFERFWGGVARPNDDGLLWDVLALAMWLSGGPLDSLPQSH